MRDDVPAMTAPDWNDAPGPVREGEAVDVERLGAYLSGVLPEAAVGTVGVEQFPSGFSNLTYLVRLGEEAVILRRPPVGVQIATAHDMSREFRILSHLHPIYDKTPEPLAYCDDPSVLGAPFYVMRRVEGVILRKDTPEEAVPAPGIVRSITEGLVDTLAELHAVDFRAAGLGELGRPDGYVGRQIAGWTKRYRAAQTEEIPTADRVAGWLAEHVPEGRPAALIHNDFKHDNVVLDPADWSRVIAVLDWEMATVGDPLMDLGTSLAYWVEEDDPPELLRARLSPTTWPGTPTRADVAERYARASGQDVPDIVFYYAYGLFKVAVIVQQLYARYVSGKTSDPRYATLIEGVRALTGLAWQAVQKGRIDALY